MLARSDFIEINVGIAVNASGLGVEDGFFYTFRQLQHPFCNPGVDLVFIQLCWPLIDRIRLGILVNVIELLLRACCSGREFLFLRGCGLCGLSCDSCGKTEENHGEGGIKTAVHIYLDARASFWLAMIRQI